MNFISKTYHTKSNQPLLIREAILKDVEQLLQLKLQYLKDTDTIPLFDYEYPNDKNEERKLIDSCQKQSNSILLIAENNGNIVGNIDLIGSWRKKMYHTAVIGMGIHTAWQNQGIGTILIQNVLDWSKANTFLEVIWLEVYATNQAGIALYQKMGFQESGIMKNFFQENEKYIDKVTMIAQVS